MEISLEEIQKKFESLPEDLRWAIMAVNVDDHIINIAQAHGLNVQQMGQMSLETHMVMFGFTHPDKFEQSLKDSLKLPDEQNKAIVNEINEKILKSIREKLMAMHSTPIERNITGGIKIEVKSANNPPSTTNAEKNNDILKQAGIEIMPNELARGKPPVRPLEQSVASEASPSLMEDKLSNSFRIPVTKTEYTLNNISKSSTPNINGSDEKEAKAAPAKTTTPTPGARGPDPYRMPIE